MYYILFYKTVDGFEDKRQAFRADHFDHIQGFVKRGELALGGALKDPADTAVLVFESDSPTPAEEFAKNDPYVKNGLVTRWEVRPWNVLVGTKL